MVFVLQSEKNFWSLYTNWYLGCDSGEIIRFPELVSPVFFDETFDGPFEDVLDDCGGGGSVIMGDEGCGGTKDLEKRVICSVVKFVTRYFAWRREIKRDKGAIISSVTEMEGTWNKGSNFEKGSEWRKSMSSFDKGGGEESLQSFSK